MERTIWKEALAIGLVLVLWGEPAKGEARCPFGDLGENPILALSIESWNALWEMSRAPGLGEKLAASIREELIPALLEKFGATEEFQTHFEDFERFSDRLEWGGLSRSRIDIVLGFGADSIPQLTIRATPPQEDLDSVERALAELLQFAATESLGALQWKEKGNQRFLALAETEAVKSSTTAARVHLSRHKGAVWITIGKSVETTVQGPGLEAREGFDLLWSMGPTEGAVALVLDFEAWARLLGKWSELLTPKVTSSLILDETMEALFEHDPETLEKLKMADAGMAFWSERLSGEGKKAADKGTELLESFGLLVYRSASIEGGTLSGTYWLPETDSEGAQLLDMNPLSDRALSLLRTSVVEVGLQSLPDFARLYRTLLEVLGATEQGREALLYWEGLQDSYGFHLDKDLLPAIGRETAWISRQVPKEGTQSFPIASNELYVFQQVGDVSTAAALLGRLEQFLSGQSIPVTSKLVGDASFTEVDTMFLGKAIWGLLKDPPVLVFAKGANQEYLEEKILGYREGRRGRLSDHPRWDSLAQIWREKPTAVVLQNAALVQNQMKSQLQGAQMMMVMMGMGDPAALAAMGLAMQVLNGVPTPDWYFRVDANEGEARVSRSLLLYPIEEKQN